MNPSPKPPIREKKQRKPIQRTAKKKVKVKKAKVKKLSATKIQLNVLNPWIRQRDSEDGFFVCISCGQTLPVSKMNAGHFVPVGRSSALRFNEFNVNGECAGCNAFDKFHLVGYRKNLIQKIGIEAVEELEARSRELKSWKQSELQEIKDRYSLPAKMQWTNPKLTKEVA